ncbi:spo12-like protein [Grosmannia clavigera kw1407]|uniref:Spo12-like protein n=1 Tax=Grosmannia clavigera (strain kw1407 / UAMH 11150) TaxID=655863 RepID=F0XG92_GROCL|nr:spo12-like protein [Grosmannia clavigera kw1407]EFX02728.1 spo12-like protein [Grosmannia clavigera kw1407]
MNSFVAAPKAVLGDKDVNAALADGSASAKDIKSMEYHRQVLQSKMDAEGRVILLLLAAAKTDNHSPKQYVSPSDNIMSPCTAKLKALRNKQVGKVKPKSLFAQASARKILDSDASPFGGRASD